ncbi:MAG: trigger factor [Mailhella sp.]|nr:trigger factor [Mailhella sp.]
MEYSIQKNAQGECRLTCSFTETEVQAAWKKAAIRFGSSASMPGFRKGKVPMNVLEKQFGQAMSDFATDKLVSRAVEHALAREGLTPVTGLDYEGGNAERGKPFSFEMIFCVLPAADVPDLAAIPLHTAEAQADAVQEELFLREMLARGANKVQVTEGTPQDGDIISADVIGRVDGRPVPGLEGPCRMRLMPPVPGEKVPDLDPIVRGLHIGETGIGTTPCPDNYPEPSLRGRLIELSATLRSIEREELPELNDVTARRLGFRNVEAMRFRAREQAMDMDRLHKRSQALQGIQQALGEWEGFEAPALMVKHGQRDALRHATQYMRRQSGEDSKFVESMAQMKAEADDAGLRKARCRALLLSWARKAGVELPKNELDAVLRGRAARQNKHPDDYLLSVSRTGEVFEIRTAMHEEKALYALYDAIMARRSAE